MDSGAFFSLFRDIPEEESEPFGVEEEAVSSSRRRPARRHMESPRSRREAQVQAFRRLRSQLRRQSDLEPQTRAGFMEDDEGRPPKVNWLRPPFLRRIFVRDLEEAKTHSGTMLVGTIIEDPLFTGSSARFLMEDDLHDVIQVAVYNLPGLSWSTAERFFPKGRRVSVAEPTLRLGSEAEMVVKVDAPNDVMDTGPMRVTDWVKLGREKVDQSSALEFFNKAWDAMETSRKELAVLFTNCSMCLGSTGRFSEALCYAGVASHLDPGNTKAKYWLQEFLPKVYQRPSAAQEPQKKTKAYYKGKKIKKGGEVGRKEQQQQLHKDIAWCLQPGFVTWTPRENEQQTHVLGSESCGHSGAQWMVLKAEGKALFQVGKWVEAEARYKQAALSNEGRAQVAVVLRFMASAFLKLGDSAASLLHSSVAAALPPASRDVAAAVWDLRARAIGVLNAPSAGMLLEDIPVPAVEAQLKELRDRAGIGG